MLSDTLRQYAEKLPIDAFLTDTFENLTADEETLLRLLYGTLPLSDTASVSRETLLAYVRHGLFLLENSPFCKNIPEEDFLQFVFYPRVNSEDLSDCRSFFYDKLKDRIQGLNEEEAILEVNRWCCENMTYQSSDDRTQSPLTSYYTGLGRCGEESTFAVTAYRSLGIPARQIYVPYWAHCDDNHAWVEVYCKNRWCFLGACEPEPILNRGWFTDASSRAPLCCYRTFFEYPGKDSLIDPLYEIRGSVYYYNVTDHYAETSYVTVKVLDEDGEPAAYCPIRLSIMNYAHYSDLVRAKTDGYGCYRIRLGKTSLHIEAANANGFAMTDIRITENSALAILMLSSEMPEAHVFESESIPPKVSPVNRTQLTDIQQAENALVLDRCRQIRNERIQSYFLPEYEEFSEDIQRILKLAGGNAPEICRFLRDLEKEERDPGLSLLKVLRPKDYKDISCEILLSHLKGAAPFFKADHFTEEILNPRIGDEMIGAYRQDIDLRMTLKERQLFTDSPESLYVYIEENFQEGKSRFYPELSMMPEATLKAGHSDVKGRKLLLIAWLRTLGVPARLNPLDGACEYYRDGGYHKISPSVSNFGSTGLRLQPQEEISFTSFGNFSLEYFHDDRRQYEVIDLSGLSVNDSSEISLAPGIYRLLTTNRLPNGNQLIHAECFRLSAGEILTRPLVLRKASPETMLSHAELEPFTLMNQDGTSVSSDELLQDMTLLLYPDPGKEPTEHILNELIDIKESLTALLKEDLKFCLVLSSPEALWDPNIQAALTALPETRILYKDNDSTASMLARKMFLEPGVWPLLLLAGEKNIGYYGTCGYSVGTGRLLLNLIHCLKDTKNTIQENTYGTYSF